MILSLLAAAALAEPRHLTVDAAIAAALEANPTIDQAALGEQIAAIDETRARLDRYAVTLGATAATGARAVVPFDGSSAYASESADWDVRAAATLPIYQGGAISARIDEAEISHRIAGIDHQLSQRDVAEAVVQAYWNIQGFDLQMTAAEDGLQLTRDALAIIQARADNGLAAAIDVNRSQVDVYGQESSILQLEHGRFQARQDLAKLLHLATDDFALDDAVPELPTEAPAPLAPPSAEQRLELHRLDAQSEAADAGIRLARSPALPQIALNADAGIGATALGGGPTIAPLPAPGSLDVADLVPAFDAGIGLALSWTPFDLYRTRDAVQVARLQRQVVDAQRRAQEDQILAEVRDAAEQLDILNRRAVVAGSELALARDNLAIIQDLYSHGSTSILELFDAQSAFRQARSQAASLAVDLVNAQWSLKFATGTDPITREPSP
jgi:outer membrane protein TolC